MEPQLTYANATKSIEISTTESNAKPRLITTTLNVWNTALTQECYGKLSTKP